MDNIDDDMYEMGSFGGQDIELDQNQNSVENNTLPVTARNFDEKKLALKEFSETLPRNTELPRVEEDSGIFGWFSHDVTGAELNNLTEKIQNIIINQNSTIINTIQEFSTIYDTFNALDKEYIQGILISLKAAEAANKKALDGIELIKGSQRDIEINQENIRQLIDKQKQFIKVLIKFKERIEKIEHLTEVDKLFNASSMMEKEFELIKTKANEQEQEFIRNKNSIKYLNQEVGVLNKKTKDINTGICFLSTNLQKKDAVIDAKIDSIKSDIAKRMAEFDTSFRNINSNITNLSEHVQKKDSEIDAKVDSINSEIAKRMAEVETSFNDIKIKTNKKIENMSVSFISEMSSNKNEVVRLNQVIENLSKDLKLSRSISFISIVLVCIFIILVKVKIL